MNRVLICLLVLQFAARANAADDGKASPSTSPPATPAQIPPEQAAFFETKVRPVLVEHCYKCHGEGKHKGNLQLDSLAHLLAGGDTGPAIVPGQPAESLLIQAINYDGYEMPPERKLSAEKIADLTQWVNMGAPWPGSAGEEIAIVRKGGEISDEDRQWWSFQPIISPPLPRLQQFSQPEHPIDAFVLAALEQKQLAPNPPASARTLIRRAFFDLIGLPPTPEEMQQWTNALELPTGVIDQSAWIRLIDELLARPQYGERWGRHWLDVVRYAQTNGYERDDEKRNAWKYRDYVIAAFNNDKPYDRFVLEQLAGDELPDANDETKIATGFYRLGLWDDEPDDAQQAEFDDLDDIVVASSAAFLGLTVGCARCHDHKFDPILHRDYYSLVAFFRNVRRFSKPELSPENSGALPLGDPLAIQAALEARAFRWAELDAKIAAAASKEEKDKLQQARKNPVISGVNWALAVRENGRAAPATHILIRGSAQTPGEEVLPEFPLVLGGGRPQIVPPEQNAPFETSGRRLALAKWLVSADHPLTARVMANRIWHYHFGRGIVSTTSDFGKVGAPPTHPELLDWLAHEFLSHGWSIKHLHRQIMLSQTYQQSSAQGNAAAEQTDPGNHFLWRQNLRRLEAEAIRDSLLAISGQLNPEMGGRGFFPLVGAEVLSGGTVPGIGWESSSPSQRHRRSIYTFIKRSLVSPQLDTFDYANTALPFTERPTTTVAPQALALLNDSFVHHLASAFANHVKREAGDDPQVRIDRAFQVALNRAPTPREMELSRQFLQQQQQEYAALQSRIVFRPVVPVSLHSSYLNPLPVTEFVEGPTEGWTPFRGKWSKTGALDIQQGPLSLWRGAVFQNTRFSTRMILGNASELAGIFLRARAAGDFVTGYEILLDARNARLSLVRHQETPKTLKSLNVAIPTGIPLQLSGELHNDRLAVQLEWSNSRVTLDAVDPEPLPVPGQFGVRTWGASVTLDGPTLHFDGPEQETQLLEIARQQIVPQTAPEQVSGQDPEWTHFDGDWTLTADHSLHPVQPTAGGKVIWKQPDFSDGAIEADVRIQGGGDAGLVVRVQHPRSGTDALTSYNVNFSKNRLRLGKHENNWRELVSVPREFRLGQWVHLRAEFQGGRIRIFVNHESAPAIDYVDPQPLPAGKVGLRTFHCPVEFRQITVTGRGESRMLSLDHASPPHHVQLAVAGLKPDESSRQAFDAFCLLLMNLNEMIYVE